MTTAAETTETKRLRLLRNDAEAAEEKARIKFCRARDRAEMLRYGFEKAKAKRDKARKAFAAAKERELAEATEATV